jgi:hypothetical protein
MELSREIVEKIEKLPIELYEKQNIILVKTGLKPAADLMDRAFAIRLSKHGHFEIPLPYLDGVYRIPTQIPKSVIEVLEGLKLPYTPPEFIISLVPPNSIIYDENAREELYEIDYASSTENLQKLIEALKITVEKERNRKFGDALGVPKTNIDYFVGDRVIEEGTVPVKLSEEQKMLLNFTNINYVTELRDPLTVEESLKLGEKYSSVLREVAPNLYEKMISKFRQNLMSQL